MPASRFVRGCLIFAVATLLLLVALLGYAWYEIDRIADSNINGKAFMMVAYELQAFVETTGRWPESEEEFLDFPRDFPDRAEMQDLTSRTIIVYDVDLAEENLDSVEGLRLLKPRDPHRFEEYVAYTHSIPDLLTTLRAARDGKLPTGDSSSGNAPQEDGSPGDE